MGAPAPKMGAMPDRKGLLGDIAKGKQLKKAVTSRILSDGVVLYTDQSKMIEVLRSLAAELLAMPNRPLPWESHLLYQEAPRKVKSVLPQHHNLEASSLVECQH